MRACVRSTVGARAGLEPALRPLPHNVLGGIRVRHGEVYVVVTARGEGGLLLAAIGIRGGENVAEGWG